jgi:hypothetical protein
MSPTLRDFVNERCIRSAAAVWQVCDLVKHFHAALPPAARKEWPRGRIINELLAAQFMVGFKNQTYHVAGIAPRGEWRTINGRLELARA